MLKRITSSLIQTRGVKQRVNVKWVRPRYIPAYAPKPSGDLEGLPRIPETAIANNYALCKEIDDAPEAVQKIFSVAHLGKREYNKLVEKVLIDRVRRHQYDEKTAETRIAQLTAEIRCLQASLKECSKNVKAKVKCQELIDKRKKLLKFLRQYDYKKFEWVLEKLKLQYKASPESFHKMSRKESLRKLTEIHCDNIRQGKLDEYRNLLESQQGPYLRDKIENLKFIRSEQVDLQLPITVTEQDIKKVEKQLEDWQIKDDIKQQAKQKKRSLLLD